MSLDGLRAWIGVVERKLTMRTRVFLVLVALAVGGAGAAVYLAVDAQNDAVTESDLEAVRDEAAGGAIGAESADLARLEAELEELREEVEELRGQGGSGGGDTRPDGGTGGGGQGGSRDGGGSGAPQSDAQLKELLERAQEQQDR